MMVTSISMVKCLGVAAGAARLALTLLDCRVRRCHVSQGERVVHTGAGQVCFQGEQATCVLGRSLVACGSCETERRYPLQIFEGTAPSGHIKVSDLVHALTTYGTTKLTQEQAVELVGQVGRRSGMRLRSPFHPRTLVHNIALVAAGARCKWACQLCRIRQYDDE